MGHTREGILAQIFVAFGQGSGTLRVSQEACAILSMRYGGRIDEGILGSWEEVAVQVLERMRAIGRTAAVEAALEGRTAISADDVRRAVPRVEEASATPLCPPREGRADPPRERGRQRIELPIETVLRD